MRSYETYDSIVDKDSPHFYMSNMYPCEFTDDSGRIFKSSEHYYQSVKMTTDEDREAVLNAPTPEEARELARSLPKQPGFDRVKLPVMARGLWYKFDQNPELKKKLLETGPMAYIEKKNDFGDIFWGTVDNHGLNVQGHLLIKLRLYFRHNINMEKYIHDVSKIDPQKLNRRK